MERDKMLDVTLAQIEKQFGKGAVMRLGEHSMSQGIAVIPTGSLALDLAHGPSATREPQARALQGSASEMLRGERALTASAMLFALLKVRPSPFCVLDEVDAPLDEANVGRFGEMLCTSARCAISLSRFAGSITDSARTDR